VRLTAPVFYAFGNSLTPAGVSIAAVALNVALNLALVRLMGYPGLALGTALASWFNAGALLVLLHRRLGGIDARRLADRLARICLAAGSWAPRSARPRAWRRSSRRKGAS
jgi:putative peptidoglycan lipid II flippase